MYVRVMCVALAGAVAACGDRASPPPPQSSDGAPATTAADSRPRVLIIGTSLTAGYGLASPDEAYPALLQQKADAAGLAFHIVNAGSSGETSAGALRRVDWLLREPARVVVIETGANDGLRGLDVDSTAANIRAIVRRVRAKSPETRIAIVQMEAPPNLGADYTTRFHAMYGEIAKETDVTLIPFLLEGVAGVAALNQGDGIHPTAAGALRVADNVWRGLRPLLSDASK